MSTGFIPPHGGFEDLHSYRKSLIIFVATYYLAPRWVRKGSRTRDQMEQSARSGKQNIVEGKVINWAHPEKNDFATEQDAPAWVEVSHNRIFLMVRPGTDQARRQAIVDEWYREQVRAAVPPILVKWERLLGVEVARFFVQKMKTKWGSSNPRTGSIRLNTDLAKKPRECLEYIVVHEMVHLQAPTHNARFISLMDKFMPKWQSRRDMLNRLPVRHEDWR